MKTNTSLAMISFDIAMAEQAKRDLKRMLVEFEEVDARWFPTARDLSEDFYSARIRIMDAIVHLSTAISNMKRKARANRQRRMSASVTRATNRSLTGIG